MSLDDNIVNFNVHHVYTGFPKGSGSNFHDVNPKEKYELRQLEAWFADNPSSFDPQGDFPIYGTGTHITALRMLNLVLDLT